jgi:class 3 adenylate cyclase
MRPDISDWLHDIGLGEYAEAFAKNEIDFGTLADLSEDDLRALGVTKLGHRKRLLRAIAEYLARPERPEQTVEAERKFFTVLFCDLVDSTALAQRYDPEVLREITNTFRNCCAAVVEANGGSIGGHRGDGILAYFGYPRSLENNAVHALYAAYRISSDVRDLQTLPGLKLDSRIGIATGEVVVGDRLSSELTEERDVVGVVPNLAARLQQSGEPGTILICDLTRERIGKLAECTSLALSLKGFAQPQQVWRVDAVREEGDRFTPTHPREELTPLVGRDQELAKLLHHWDLAERGKGQAVLLIGEAGIGKTRMFHSLLARLPESKRTLIQCFCMEHHRTSALSPIISLLERRAAFERGDSPTTKLEKLDRMLAETESSADVAPLYAALLSIPAGDRYPALGLAPELQKERTLAALETHLRVMSAVGPVLFFFEDIHWADPTTEELVARILRWLPDSPIMLLMAGRPEVLSAPWVQSPSVSRLTLQRLNADHSHDVIEHVLGRRTIAHEVKRNIVEKSDGIPLFLEEIAKAVVDRAEAKTSSSSTLDAEIAVPRTLQDSLAARLDRLPGAKRVAQIGATIGREFHYEVLAAVCPLSKKEVARALDLLTGADVLKRTGVIPNAVYSFKHALLRDWAYKNQLRSERAKLHRAIAAVLEERFPDDVAAEPQLLAHHYSEAGDYRRAITYRLRAANRSADRAAYTEALKHVERAFEHLANLPDDR